MASSPWENTITTWSSTQSLTSFSSGKAEYFGLNKGVGQGLGYQGLMQDFGVVLPLELHCDSAAARGIAKRRGLGKQRHIDLQSLWIQVKMAQGAFRLNPISGKENPSDLLTKHLSSHYIQSCLDFMNCEFRFAGWQKEGRTTP